MMIVEVGAPIGSVQESKEAIRTHSLHGVFSPTYACALLCAGAAQGTTSSLTEPVFQDLLTVVRPSSVQLVAESQGHYMVGGAPFWGG